MNSALVTGYKKIILAAALALCTSVANSQVRIRIFAAYTPESAVIAVAAGSYELDHFNGVTTTVGSRSPVIITRYNGRLAVKSGVSEALICDSVRFRGLTGNDRFYVRLNGVTVARREYSGDLACYPDLGTIVLVNKVSTDNYIAGVVKAEGGSGKGIEYFKTQAVIARTYMYRHLNKHLPDRYNLCDETHCQVFRGLTVDSLIIRATALTAGKVILGSDSSLIIAAFHSNCGGETASSEDVWLTHQSYLRPVTDTYCRLSRNAAWEKKLSLAEWVASLRRCGYTGSASEPSSFSFVQLRRQANYRTGTFSVPLKTIRADLGLRSAFFSVAADGQGIVLRGRGYGHGVGLCQEGAMAMAARGINYEQIIKFYYTGVIIADIKDARPGRDEPEPSGNWFEIATGEGGTD